MGVVGVRTPSSDRHRKLWASGSPSLSEGPSEGCLLPRHPCPSSLLLEASLPARAQPRAAGTSQRSQGRSAVCLLSSEDLLDSCGEKPQHPLRWGLTGIKVGLPSPNTEGP